MFPLLTWRKVPTTIAIGTSGSREIAGQPIQGWRGRSIAHKTDVKIHLLDHLESAPYCPMNPRLFIAKGTAAQFREEHDVRGMARRVDYGGPHGGFVGTFEDERCKGRPAMGVDVRVAHREGRAECLRHEEVISLSARDLHAPVKAHTQEVAERVALRGGTILEYPTDRGLWVANS